MIRSAIFVFSKCLDVLRCPLIMVIQVKEKIGLKMGAHQD